MLAKIAIGLAAVLAVLAIVVATRPDAFLIQRTATIAAPAEVVYAQLDDLHRWGQWNPFEKSDPGIRLAFAGPASGVGSSYHFVGKRAGEGRMTISGVRPNERVTVRADFIKPMAATHQIEFTLKPAPGGVAVTWAMSGRNGFLGKAVSLVMNMDRMVGGEFEKGLADLKRVSEAQASTAVAAR
ncbi:SRPBCC family protein [Longimicrobium sp.]|uniref:SRPBCC family protein n=1 Tax=Longimicrobium sp. TaxID=2029185 RepID=UPI002C03B7CE|nr:SRPBCC family protein [Longimicrobium sp.]HSU14344.1 SRPBCC family protein [Longimicrobium sp.]